MKNFMDSKNLKLNKESALIVVLAVNFVPCCRLAHIGVIFRVG
ncbi:MAG: hypothetical protein V8R85_10835 [Frisingicoccus sp.]